MLKTGQSTEPILVTVSRAAVRDYCDAVWEENPMYRNIQAAKEAGYPDLPLPATYPALFWQKVEVPWLQNMGPLVQTSQTFTYHEPLLANQTYTCSIMLNQVRAFGQKQLLYHTLDVRKEDRLIATSETTLMIEKNHQ